MESKNIVNTEALGSKFSQESPENDHRERQESQELTAPAEKNILFGDGKSKLKKTIIASTIGGTLLAGFLGLTSFGKKPSSIDEPVVPMPDDKLGQDKEHGSEHNHSNHRDVQPTHTNPATTLNTSLEEKKPVSINTEHEVYTKLNDDKTLDEARELARKEVGNEALFTHKGELHPTMTNDEWDHLSENEKLAFINKVNVEVPATGPLEITGVDADGVSHHLVVDPLHSVGKLQFGSDDSGHVFCLPQGQPAFELHNVTIDDQGGLTRTDPTTGDISLFSVEEIFTKIDQDGAFTSTVSIPDVDHVLGSGDPGYPYPDVVDMPGAATPVISDAGNHDFAISDKNADVKNTIDEIEHPVLGNHHTPISDILHSVINDVVDPLTEHKNPNVLNAVSNIMTPIVENQETPLANTIGSILQNVVDPLAENKHIDTNIAIERISNSIVNLTTQESVPDGEVQTIFENDANADSRELILNDDNVDYGSDNTPADLDNGVYNQIDGNDAYAIDNGNVDLGNNNDDINTEESYDSNHHGNHPITDSDRDNNFNQDDSL